MDYSDEEYYKQYPTIFHLRKELIENRNPHDVRLVYLTILNMFKHRGHFLIESDGNIGGNTLEIFKQVGFEVVEEQTWKKFGKDVKGILVKLNL